MPQPGQATAQSRVLARTQYHLARVPDIFDDQRRQPREHSPHKTYNVSHD